MENIIISLSDLDTDRFGIKSARAKQVTYENLPEVMAFCFENQVKFLVARCASIDIQTVHALEKNGFNLMDTLVYLHRSITADSIPVDAPKAIIRPFTAGDELGLEEVARAAFTGFYGHYHSDPRLDPQDCTEAYVSWAQRCSTDPQAADIVFVAEMEGKIAGFRAIRMNSPQEGDLILAGVSPTARRMGIYRSFLIAGMQWCLAQGATQVITSTHIANIGIQRACTKEGFEVKESFHTFHRWFD